MISEMLCAAPQHELSLISRQLQATQLEPDGKTDAATALVRTSISDEPKQALLCAMLVSP